MTSAVSMAASLPVVTASVSPTPRWSSGIVAAPDIIPLWKTIPTSPGIISSQYGWMATIRSWALSRPRQFGPMTGMPVRAAQAAISAWRSAPAASTTSEKPLVTMQTPPTRRSSHCSRMLGTSRCATPTTTRSRSPDTSRTVGKQGASITRS
jgi:hypothetical protein